MNSFYKEKLGSYACGGKCSDEGFVGEDAWNRSPCPKCKVFVVTPGEFYSNSKGSLVRGRTAEEAMKIYAREHLSEVKLSARLLNHEHDKSSVSFRWRRKDLQAPWARVLSRPEPEEAIAQLAGLTYRKMNTTLRDWKLTPSQAAAAVNVALVKFMKENGLMKVSS